MDFDTLLDRVWYYDIEIFAHDCLVVFISHKTKERVYFHNSFANDIQMFLDKYEPILIGYNCNNYDKWILKCWLAGYTPEELKEVNDYIIGGGKGWEIDCGRITLPIHWDLFNEINPRKSLKEIEGNLRLDITETTVPFDLPTKWTKEQFEEVLYYCTCDVEALIPLFDKLKVGYKSKYIIAKFGNIEPAYALSQTNANLTAILLGAERQEYNDNFSYTYPSCIDKSKIPKQALNYFDELIEHNDLDYYVEPPLLELKDILFQLGIGGGHGFKKKGVYIYDRSISRRILCNWDFTSLYPNLVRLFGYSSRSQSSKDGYVNVLRTRMSAKKGQLGEDFLSPMGLTNKDLNTGLKLPLNAYTGALRAKFNNLYDNLQGFSICTTGQLIILQLIHDLEQVPTVEMVSANTDAVMFEVDPEYKEETDKIIHNLEKLTGLEMEEDNIVRIVMANVNNYCELLQVGENDYKINYKGGQFKCNSIQQNLKVLWDKDNETWHTEFTDDVKANSLTIVGEALLKKLLLDIPVEETINNCNDIFRFQMISHLGSTYEKCVQESPNGDIELQRNNRIYAGNVPRGTIIKVKPDGRRDSLADCPPNPIVDNANELTINEINRQWYIEMANLKVNDFMGVPRLESLKKDELLERATKLGLEFDKKIKKVDLIELIKNKERNEVINMATKQELEERLEKATEQNEKLVAKLQEQGVEQDSLLQEIKENYSTNPYNYGVLVADARLQHKIQELRKKIRATEFVLDKELPSNLGGGEYHSIRQYYNAIQSYCIEIGLNFKFETVNLLSFEKDCTKPSNGLPIHVATVQARATLKDIDTGVKEEYFVIGQGSDTIDKAVSGAETMAFRQWFSKNFTPKNGDDEDLNINEEPKSEAPKVPVYIPETKKEEIKKEVVEQVQQEESDDEDIKAICENIMKVRELTQNEEYGKSTMEKLLSGTLSSADILEIDLKVKNKLEKVGA